VVTPDQRAVSLNRGSPAKQRLTVALVPSVVLTGDEVSVSLS
jgi:hypothetical protein